MMSRRTLAMLHARNMEFLRDRSSLSWTLILPILLVLGMAFIFSGERQPLFKVAYYAKDLAVADATLDQRRLPQPLQPFFNIEPIQFYPTDALQQTVQKVGRHQVDMVLDIMPDRVTYWINQDSSKGSILESLLQGSFDSVAAKASLQLTREAVEGRELRYVDWVVPGILGMNVMFSCLFGVGYVIVRYRKSGYLKRLSATPLTALEFLVAQVLSRLALVVAITTMIFLLTHWLLDFIMEGSYLLLLLILTLGSFSMIALSLVISSRVTSEELASGLLNVLSWPMMILSGVWFSMEGTHPWLQAVSQLSPLTHMLSATRAVMFDGVGVSSIWPQLLLMTALGIVCLFLGARIFRWRAD